MFEKHFKMVESVKVDDKFKRAFNLGYEVAKELDLKVPMFSKEGSDITLKSPIQAGMFQFVQFCWIKKQGEQTCSVFGRDHCEWKSRCQKEGC